MTAVGATAGETRDAQFLREVGELLWPGATTRVGGAEPTADFLVVLPSRQRPRVLVPGGARRAAVAALRSGTEQTSTRARARTLAVAALFSAGVAERVFRDRLPVTSTGSITAHLAAVLDRPLLVGVRLGPARANRKPVLQLLSPDGEVTGFAKVGVNDLTNALVAAEARALTRLAAADLGPVEVPRVLYQGGWHGLTVLVQSALPVRRARARDVAPHRRAAMVSVAAALGQRVHPAGDNPHLRRLQAACAALPDGPGRAALRRGLDAVASRPDRQLRFGCWHGDWTSGNMAVLRDRVLVWDWERFDADVPVGLDALHQHLMELLTEQGRHATEAVARLVERAPTLLAPFGVPAADADLVVTLYLVEIGLRYLQDRQAEVGPAFGRVDYWLLPAVTALADRITERTS